MPTGCMSKLSGFQPPNLRRRSQVSQASDPVGSSLSTLGKWGGLLVMVPPLPLTAFVPLARARGPWGWVHTQPFADWERARCMCVCTTASSQATSGTQDKRRGNLLRILFILGVTVLHSDFCLHRQGVSRMWEGKGCVHPNSVLLLYLTFVSYN